MDRKMKKIDFRPQEFRTMDPSFRYGMWLWEKNAGHLFSESRRTANYQSVLLALAIGVLYGGCILWGDMIWLKVTTF